MRFKRQGGRMSIQVVNALGVNPVHFGIIFVLCCEIDFLTPPLGVNLFVAMRLTGCSIENLSKSALPYVLVLMLTLWVPNLIYGPQRQ